MLALAVASPNTNDEYLQLAITRHYLLMRAFKYEEAFGYTNDTLVFMPDNPDLLYARALVAAELRKLNIAEQDLRKVIAIDPQNANAMNALGYTLADQTDRLDEAKVLIAQALVLRPNDAHILDSWGWVSYRLKDYVTAIEFLRRAYEASPEAEVAAHLGEALWESGDQDAAIDVWQQAYDKESDNPVLTATLQRYQVDFKNANKDAIKSTKNVAVEP
jgi:tetratricopeptide (TPR) repeat protein